jgi:putative oxidoreductase
VEAYGPALLRVVTGATFAAHGAQKLFGIWGGGGLRGTAAYFDTIGLSPGFPLAVTVAVVEFAGGMLLMAGALTRYVCIALALVMLGRIWKIQLAHGFFINWALMPGRGHGVESSLMMIAALICLMLTGPGAFSVDHRRARDAEAYAAGRARLRRKL